MIHSSILTRFAFSAIVCGLSLASNVVPGKVVPSWPQTWDLQESTIAMICNASGWVDPAWGAQWGLVDLDWNGDKLNWSEQKPMNVEEDMVANMAAVKAINPKTKTWVYRACRGVLTAVCSRDHSNFCKYGKRNLSSILLTSPLCRAGNSCKALPWHTTVRKLLEDRSQWGLFMPLAGCMPTPGEYVCGPNATQNLYHDFEQTPHGDCGTGVECGEYVFNHLNASLTDFLLGEYFFGANGAANAAVDGYYVDDDWSSKGCSEMDANELQKMGLTPAQVTAMVAAWQANQQLWRSKLVAAGKFEWGLFYGGQQTAPGQNQTCGQCTCASFLAANCGADSPSQNGTLFYGYSRTAHSTPFPLPSPDQDLAAFLLARGPYAYFGYGWTGCIDATHPFTRPASLGLDLGAPQGFCGETAPGSGVWQREYEKYTVSLDCGAWQASFVPK